MRTLIPELEQAIKSKIASISLSEEFVSSDATYPSGQHVCLVFCDGELSSTKAGSLLHQRSLHCFYSGIEEKRVPSEWFPYKMNGYGFVYCKHDPDGKELRELILQ